MTRVRHLVAVSCLVASALPAVECERPYVMGWEPWEPYQYLDADGELVGFDVELMTAAFAVIGCEVEFRQVPWSRHLADLERGTIDLAAGANKNDEREVFASYSDPWRVDTIRLFVRAADRDAYPISGIADLAGTDFRLGVTRGYVYGEAFFEARQNPEFRRLLQEVDAEELNYEKLVKDRIDGFLADTANVAAYLRKEGLKGRIVAHPVAVFGGSSYVMFSRKSTSPELVQAFDAALESLRGNGTYERLRAKYLELE